MSLVELPTETRRALIAKAQARSPQLCRWK
jgi:hypothetical protein